MEFQDVVRKRRMVRAFENKPVPEDALDRIMRNALHAPSAGFSQGWGFLVLQDPQARALFWETEWPERLDQAYQQISRAPVIIVPMSNKQAYLDRYAEPDKGWTDKSEDHWPVPFWDIDTGFASLLMLLSVVNEGLAAVFIGMWGTKEFRAAFGVPDNLKPIGAIALGYRAPDERSPSLKRGRTPLETVMRRDRWS